MKKILSSIIICSSMLVAANNNYNYEITPLISGAIPEGNLSLKDQTNYGLSLGKNLSDKYYFDQLEFGILNSTSTKFKTGNEKTTITRYFTNLIKDYELSKNSSLYGLVGLGYENFSKPRFENEDDGFANYGIGLKYRISDNVNLKTDIRHLITFDGANSLLYTLGLGISFGKIYSTPEISEKPQEEIVKEKSIVKKVMKKTPVILDDDKDGVNNNLDECPTTIKGVIVDEKGCAVTINLHIHFDSDSAVIQDTYDNKIEEFADFLKKYPEIKVKIEAHTDSSGSTPYNEKLSQSRANSTVTALKKLGIDPSRLEAIGYGELKPIDTNNTEAGKANNRRVEAKFIQ